jgi:hypothetical protein
VSSRAEGHRPISGNLTCSQVTVGTRRPGNCDGALARRVKASLPPICGRNPVAQHPAGRLVQMYVIPRYGVVHGADHSLLTTYRNQGTVTVNWDKLSN